MKKFLVAFLALFMLLSFTGCADNSTDTPPTGDTEIEATQPEEEKPNDTDQSDDNQQPDDTQPSEEKEITAMYVYVNGNKLEVTLEKNSSAEALVEILKKGDITYTADDYGNFEKVGNIGYTLPTNDVEIDTQAGDVILYQGNNICLYYGTNSWDFTRLGKINGYSISELRTLLGAGSGTVQVKISLK